MKTDKDKALELKALYDSYPVFPDKEALRKQIFSYFKEKLLGFDLAAIRVFCKNFKEKFRYLPTEMDARKFCDDFCQKFSPVFLTKIQERDIWDEVEEYIAKFITANPDLVIEAKNEGWLGEPWKKGMSGLLGYMRTSFALQIKIIGRLEERLPIYQNEFVNYFRSIWFKDEVLKNGQIENFYKKEHFEIIKQKKI